MKLPRDYYSAPELAALLASEKATATATLKRRAKDSTMRRLPSGCLLYQLAMPKDNPPIAVQPSRKQR